MLVSVAALAVRRIMWAMTKINTEPGKEEIKYSLAHSFKIKIISK